MSFTAWDPDLAFGRAVTAYRYVARTLPPDADPSPLDAHTDAAYQAERAGDLEAFTEALRALCRAARDEARRAAA